MAARKKSTRKKAGARPGRAAANLRGRLAEIEAGLPPTLRDYAQQVRSRLDRLERELTRAQTDVRRRVARLLREASHQLGRLEARGEAGWRSLASPYRKQLLDLLKRLEKAVSPAVATARKTARKATRKPRAARRPAAAEAPSA